MNKNLILSPILATGLLATNIARAEDLCEDAVRVEVPAGQTVWGKTAMALIGHYDGIEQNLEESRKIAEALMEGGRIYELNMKCADEAARELLLDSDTQWVDYGYDIDWGSFSTIRTTQTRFDEDGQLIPELMFRTRDGQDGIYFDNVESFLMPKDLLGYDAKKKAKDDNCIDEDELTDLTGRVETLEIKVEDHEVRITKLEDRLTEEVPETIEIVPEQAPVETYDNSRDVDGDVGLNAVYLKEHSRQDSGADLTGYGLEAEGSLAIPAGQGSIVVDAEVLGGKLVYDNERDNVVLVDGEGLLGYSFQLNENLALVVGGRAEARVADVDYAGVEANTSRKTAGAEAELNVNTDNLELLVGVYGGVGNVRTDVDLDNYNMTVDPTTVIGTEVEVEYQVGPVEVSAGVELSKYSGTKTSQDAGQISDVDTYVSPEAGVSLHLGPVELGVSYELMNMGNGSTGGNTTYSHVGKAGVTINF